MEYTDKNNRPIDDGFYVGRDCCLYYLTLDEQGFIAETCHGRVGFFNPSEFAEEMTRVYLPRQSIDFALRKTNR